jgi:hypothetical protein
MLLLQGRGGQSVTEPVPPLADEAVSLRAGWGAWVIATYENDPMTGEPAALAVLDGQGDQGGRLSVGCAEGSNSLSVQWNQYLGATTSEVDIDIRVDDSEAAGMQWEIARDGDATILREEEAAEFAASLYGGTRLDLETMAPTAGRISVGFDITGIEDVVPLVQAHCGW